MRSGQIMNSEYYRFKYVNGTRVKFHFDSIAAIFPSKSNDF